MRHLQNLGVSFAAGGVANEVFLIDAADLPDDGRHDRLQIVSLHQSGQQLRQRRRRTLVMGQNLKKKGTMGEDGV